ncbi:PepSY-associated TM helix domain-containing protein [Methylomonas albis]|uniref:PepSY domain-containing protein n=1 Tax=Methylomonas albis TaxID=1854563 RepID=A0ABR9D4I2_9GAMM|nr:PepSY domain-containing protein [Methylomonas albis]MBD9357129.1 PepSY domain-containing protein [Methylomonas albis]
MSARSTFKVWYGVHQWTSLVCTLFMLLLCLTGLPLIFAEEIDLALGRNIAVPERPDDQRQADVDAIVADALARRPGDTVQFLVGDAEEPDLWSVRLGKTAASSDVSAFYLYDARNGEFLHAVPLDSGFINLMFRLHYDLFAGLPGSLLLGAMGLLLLASLVSGAVLYHYHMAKLPFGTVRRAGSSRLRWLDLHNLLGIATLVWLAVVGLTGVVNTVAEPIFQRWQDSELAAMLAPYQGQAPVNGQGRAGAALAAALRAAPDMALSFMAFPGNEFAGPRQFVAFLQGNTPLTSQLLTPVLIDAATSEVLAQRELPAYVKALLLSKPLHFGNYGGLPLKCLWLVLDLIAIAVLISGVHLWLAQRRWRLPAVAGAAA